MPNTRFIPIPTGLAHALTRGEPDAYGNTPERSISDGQGNPCRHCLDYIPEGAPMLTLAYRPFRALHPYAETGQIFLCADPCAPWREEGTPPILKNRPDYLLKAYGLDGRIIYGTGKVTPQFEIDTYAATLLALSGVAFVDVRSSSNNCFLVRINKA